MPLTARLTGSSTRYERWRRAACCPGKKRRGAGRGHGSVSVLDAATVEIAAGVNCSESACPGRGHRDSTRPFRLPGPQELNPLCSTLPAVSATAERDNSRGRTKRMTQYFGYAVDRRYLPVLLPFRFKRDRDGVTLTDDALEATFGFFRVTTTRDNITGAHITRNYRWWTAFGVRGSMADDGLSFGTNHEAGVCIHFAEKVPSRLSQRGHSALTVTVEDLEGLTRALGGDPDGDA